MSCLRCAEEAAAGRETCQYCGEFLVRERGEDAATRVSEPPPDAPELFQPVHRPGTYSSVAAIGLFIAGFFLGLVLLGIGAAVGSVAGPAAAIALSLAGPIALFLLIRSSVKPLALGSLSALALVVIVFGGCLMVLM